MTVRVEIIRSFCLGQGIDALAGQVIEVPDARARLLIAQGKARPHIPPPAPQPAAVADTQIKSIRRIRNA
jgi:hypothetical protein